ncbi:transmembrane protein 200A [Antennarius striatus]|uniref:transmembrane protein 200A n=1 Tax=Antennarius striatus TaxID=241820 RepID=UPI0035AFB217
MKSNGGRNGGRGTPAASPPSKRRCCFSLRGRKKKEGVVRGKLRMRSTPGAFMVVGVVVVLVGTGLAMAGYWPYRMNKSSFLDADADRDGSQTSGWSLGLLSAGVLHSEQMKLLGPVVMGVGLFILICANTVLYENRDRETQMLLAQMRSVICSVSTAMPSAHLQEGAAANQTARHYQWVSSLPAAQLNVLCLHPLASSEPLLPRGTGAPQQDLQDVYQLAVLQTQAPPDQESKAPPSVGSAHSRSSPCHSSQRANRQSAAEPGGGGSVTPHLNSLVSASSMSTLGVDEGDAPPQPRRCHSMSYRTNRHAARAHACPSEGGRATPPVPLRKEAESQVCLNIPEQMEEQTHRSWPQVDLGGGRRYLELEGKEDSVDKLLDLLAQRGSQGGHGFGSGPFQ